MGIFHSYYYSLCQSHEFLYAVVRRQVSHVHLVIVVGLRIVTLVGRLVNYLRVDGHHRVARVHAKRGHHAAKGTEDEKSTAVAVAGGVDLRSVPVLRDDDEKAAV